MAVKGAGEVRWLFEWEAHFKSFSALVERVSEKFDSHLYPASLVS